jgi:tripartite-type tricarboxylate transporter receptor subunit TctC
MRRPFLLAAIVGGLSQQAMTAHPHASAILRAISFLGFSTIAGGSATAAGAADAVKDFPLRPVRLVSPFAAGGNTDIIGRLLAPRLSERLGQNVIVENRPGAGSLIGTAYVARATPDGHTLLMASGAFTSVVATVRSLPFDPLKDFAWISLIVTYPFVVVVKADSPVNSISDLIAAAKKNPGKLNYASVGTGSVFHLAAELFNTMARTDLTHIPYKGGAEPVTELVAGRIDVIFTTLTGVFPQIEAKRVKPIAIASSERSPQLPNVPTVAQTLPGYDVTSFAGLAATGGTPRAVIARLNRELHAVLALPEINKRLLETGGDVRPSSPEEMGRHVAGDIAKWKRVVAEKKIELQ